MRNRKFITSLVGGCIIIGLAVSGMSGCGSSNSSNSSQPKAGTRAFVDRNQDGICDNSGMRMGRGNGGAGKGGFFDCNNDGICDRTGRRISMNRN